MKRDHLATVLRVCGCEGFEADIDLGFGVHVHRHVRLRRREDQYVYAGKGAEANHCLVVLVGGKQVLLHDACEEARWVVADVYLTSPQARLPQVSVAGSLGAFIDVHAAMCWAAGVGWDARKLREALRP